MAIATLADVHAHLNIPAADTSHDTELQGFLDAASSIAAYVAGPVDATPVVEVRDGGSPVIMLDVCPVLSIESVMEYVGLYGRALTSQPPGSTTDNYGYSLDDAAAGKLVRRSAAGTPMAFWGGPGAVTIHYTAGRSTVPPDVRLATLEDIRGLYQQTQQGGRASLGGGAIGAGGDDVWTAGPLHLFPRLASLLDASRRTQSIG